VTLIADCAVPTIIDAVDAVVVGADSILPNGSFINKTGTHALAILANQKLVPVYVLCDTSKIRHLNVFHGEVGATEEFYDSTWNPEKTSGM
jgi:translation initiation factor 2B subunit (eIF-2B alpha/beta/delta family)